MLHTIKNDPPSHGTHPHTMWDLRAAPCLHQQVIIPNESIRSLMFMYLDYNMFPKFPWFLQYLFSIFDICLILA